MSAARASGRSTPVPLPGALRAPLLLLAAALAAATSAPAGAAPLSFDETTGEILIHTDRGGLLGFAGHRHRIRAEGFRGRLAWETGADVPSSLEVQIDAAALTVVDEDLDAEDVAKVQADMETDVLEIASFPEVTFTASAMERDGGDVLVTGTLDLHGVAREIAFPLAVERTDEAVLLSGELRVRQSDHDIRAVSAALGSVKVKDEVRIEIRIEARAEAPPLDRDGPSSAG